MRLFTFLGEWLVILKTVKRLKKDKKFLEDRISRLTDEWDYLRSEESHTRTRMNSLIREYEELNKKVMSIKHDQFLYDPDSRPNRFKAGFVGLLRESRALLDAMASRFYEFEGDLNEFTSSSDMAFVSLSDIVKFIEEARQKIENLTNNHVSNDFAKAAIISLEQAIRYSSSGSMGEAYFHAVVASVWAEAAVVLEEILGGKYSRDKSQFADYYDILGVPFGADPDKVRSAYRKRAKETHPDTNGTGTGDEFLKVEMAYSILSDPFKRHKYDEEYLKA